MAVSNLNGIAFTGISAILGITRSSLSAIGGQTITAGGAGIAEVGSGTQRAGTVFANTDSKTLAFPANVTSGDLLIVGGSVWSAGGAPTAIPVSDTRSTTYTTLLGTIAGVAWRPFIAYGIAPSSGACTVTVDPDTTGNYGGFSIDEFSGVNATPLDVDGGSSTGTSTSPSDGLTTVTANDLIIGAMSYDALASVTPGGSYTEIGELEDIGNEWTYSLVFRLVTTAQAYTVDWTLSTSATWSAQSVAFKPA